MNWREFCFPLLNVWNMNRWDIRRCIRTEENKGRIYNLQLVNVSMAKLTSCTSNYRKFFGWKLITRSFIKEKCALSINYYSSELRGIIISDKTIYFFP